MPAAPLKTSQRTHRVRCETEGLTAISVHNDGELVFAGAVDGGVFLYALPDFVQLDHKVSHSAAISSVCFITGLFISVADSVILWQVTDKTKLEIVLQVPLQFAPFKSAAYMIRHSSLISIYLGTEMGQICQVDINTNPQSDNPDKNSHVAVSRVIVDASVSALAILQLPTALYVIAGTSTGMLMLLDPHQNFATITSESVERSCVTSISPSEDGTSFIASSADGQFSVWGMANQRAAPGVRPPRIVRIGSLPLDCSTVSGCSWNGTTRHALVCADNHVLIVDMETFSVVRQLEPHTQAIVCAVWHPDGDKVLTCGHEAEIKLHDINASTHVAVIVAPGTEHSGSDKIAVSITGRYLVGYSHEYPDGGWIRDTKLASTTGIAPPKPVRHVSWSNIRENLCAITFVHDKIVLVWDADKGVAAEVLRCSDVALVETQWSANRFERLGDYETSYIVTLDDKMGYHVWHLKRARRNSLVPEQRKSFVQPEARKSFVEDPQKPKVALESRRSSAQEEKIQGPPSHHHQHVEYQREFDFHRILHIELPNGATNKFCWVVGPSDQHVLWITDNDRTIHRYCMWEEIANNNDVIALQGADDQTTYSWMPQCMSFCVASRLVACGCTDGKIRLLDTNSCTVQLEISPRRMDIPSTPKITWAADGSMLLLLQSAENASQVSVWTINVQEQLFGCQEEKIKSVLMSSFLRKGSNFTDVASNALVVRSASDNPTFQAWLSDTTGLVHVFDCHPDNLSFDELQALITLIAEQEDSMDENQQVAVVHHPDAIEKPGDSEATLLTVLKQYLLEFPATLLQRDTHVIRDGGSSSLLVPYGLNKTFRQQGVLLDSIFHGLIRNHRLQILKALWPVVVKRQVFTYPQNVDKSSLLQLGMDVRSEPCVAETVRYLRVAGKEGLIPLVYFTREIWQYAVRWTLRDDVLAMLTPGSSYCYYVNDILEAEGVGLVPAPLNVLKGLYEASIKHGEVILSGSEECAPDGFWWALNEKYIQFTSQRPWNRILIDFIDPVQHVERTGLPVLNGSTQPVPVESFVSGIPGITCSDFVKAIARSPDSDLLRVPLLQHMFEFKWRAFGRRVFLVRSVHYLIFLAILTCLSFNNLANEQRLANHSEGYLLMAFRYYIVLATFYWLYSEFLEFRQALVDARQKRLVQAKRMKTSASSPAKSLRNMVAEMGKRLHSTKPRKQTSASSITKTPSLVFSIGAEAKHVEMDMDAAEEKERRSHAPNLSLELLSTEVFVTEDYLAASKSYISFWNLIDWFTIVSILSSHLRHVLLFDIPDGTVDQSALIVVVAWTKMLYFATAFRGTAPIVQLVVSILADIAFMTLIIVGFTTSFGAGFAILGMYDGFGDSLLNTFGMLLGNFDIDLVQSYGPVAVLLFICYELLVAMILWNSLIAIMSKTYEKLSSDGDTQFHFQRATIIHELQAALATDVRDLPTVSPTFLHILIPEGVDVEMNDAEAEEQGQSATEQQTMEAIKRLERDLASVQMHMKDSLASISCNIQKLQRTIDKTVPAKPKK